MSLGGVESLIEHPATMTHTDTVMSREDKEASRITDNLIRLRYVQPGLFFITLTRCLLNSSVGLEDVDDLKADLESALDRV